MALESVTFSELGCGHSIQRTQRSEILYIVLRCLRNCITTAICRQLLFQDLVKLNEFLLKNMRSIEIILFPFIAKARIALGSLERRLGARYLLTEYLRNASMPPTQRLPNPGRIFDEQLSGASHRVEAHLSSCTTLVCSP